VPDRRLLSGRDENCYFPLPPPKPQRQSLVIDWVFLIVTGFIAYHGLTYRDPDGETDVGHLLFGAIALLFFMRVLIVDILGLW
jgi:hypothetical protein